ESTGYAVWFHALMQRLGHTVLVGDAAKIRAMVVRKTKTDRRDALHILDLLRHDRFPTIWLPDPATRDLRALLTHRTRPVRIPTHPGVGALTALATVVVLGPVARFSDSKHVVSYVGLAPTLNASADKYHLGHITKQGSTLLRFALGQAAAHAARMDADLKRT